MATDTALEPQIAGQKSSGLTFFEQIGQLAVGAWGGFARLVSYRPAITLGAVFFAALFGVVFYAINPYVKHYYIIEFIEFCALFVGLLFSCVSYQKITDDIRSLQRKDRSAQASEAFNKIIESIRKGQLHLFLVIIGVFVTFLILMPIKNGSVPMVTDPEKRWAADSIIIFRISLLCWLYYTYIVVNRSTLMNLIEVNKCDADKSYDLSILNSAFFLKEENSPTQGAYAFLLFIILFVIFGETVGFIPSDATINIVDFAGGAAAFHLILSAYRFYTASMSSGDILEKMVGLYYAAAPSMDIDAISTNLKEIAGDASGYWMRLRFWAFVIVSALAMIFCFVERNPIASSVKQTFLMVDGQ